MLTSNEIQQAWEKLCLRDYEFFLTYTGRKQWRTAKHLKLVCQKLEAVERGEIKRLIINMAPRHGKSEITSKNFGAWALMKDPTKEIVIASYGADISTDFSRIARNKFEEWAPKLSDYQLAHDSAAVSRWGVAGYRGGCTAVGIGGSLTGRGADILIIDDYCKDWQSATSETVKQRTWEWYTSTARTRISPMGAIVIVATPWTDDDLCGRLMKEMEEGTGEGWEVIRLPAYAEDDDPLGRQVGETLWPERFTDKWYADTKLAVGSQVWNSLYQCRPSPVGGVVLKRDWFKFYDVLPEMQSYVISVDATFKDGDTNDYVVMQCWGKKGAEYYLIDQIRDRMDFPTTLNTLRIFCNKHQKAVRKLIEDKANGSAIISVLRREIGGIIPINPQGSKTARVSAMAPYVEAGNVFIPRKAIWVGDFVEECVVFPNGKHDDSVDAMSQAINNFNSVTAKPTVKAY